jgi:anthranilate phosphoribosyltransferase
MTDVLERLIGGRDLTEAEAREMMGAIMSGEWSDTRMAAALVALRMKGETSDELVGFAGVMREKARPFWEDEAPIAVLDTCGTGGDGSGTFNISTAAAFVAAGAGAVVAKHGNRGASSRSGSADVLEALGVDIQMPVEKQRRALREVGIAFLFAQAFHGAMRFVMPTRKALGVRTVFNILGPLASPASARYQVIGVSSAGILTTMAEAASRLGVEHVFVVHGQDGTDEVSLSGPTDVVEVVGGQQGMFTIHPSDVGLETSPPESLAGGGPEDNARIIESVLAGDEGAPLDAVLMNAALALVAAGLAPDLAAGFRRARDSVLSGEARGRLDALRRLSEAP